ncbi:MAG: UvrD-helicase domain-containing protein, partial [Thermanaeromonas sp.]|uniref:UvrD-helicase domain-containing protein n=1 Tax=Thermanaeromonas sp. TaxID=2003697 RepID=UPI00243C7A66
EGVRPPDARPYQSLVPLPEVIASALGVGVSSKQVMQRYFSLLRYLGPELFILQEAPLEEIARVAGALVAEAVRRMREGEIEVHPGFDGEYGKIILLKPEERVEFSGQATLFGVKAVTEEVAEEEEVSGASRKFEQGVKPPESPQEKARAEGLKGENGITFSPSPLLTGLNPQQIEAVTAEEGPVVVIAGPGTGKTRTLVYRLAYLLGEKKVPPGDVAAVTFTNKAAEEIKERAEGLLKGMIHGKAFTVGTFHSICLDLLRQVYGLEFTLLDEADVLEIWKEVLRERTATGKEKARRLKEEISLLKSRGLEPSSPGVPPDLRRFYEAYQERLFYYRALDYDDLLLEALRREEARAAQGEPGRFAHLLVDEFQDVNPVQYRLVCVWAGDGRNLFVIGDPDQAIYGFRGADHRFFFKLQEEFPQAKVIRLVLNYRSTPTILKAACGLLRQKEFQLKATRGDGPRILYMEVPSDMAEGIAVVREIEHLVGGSTMLHAHGQYTPAGQNGVEIEDKSYSFSDIAVLFRTSRELQKLEECFFKEGIPYRVIGRESFLEDPKVREAIEFFRCVNSPEDDFYLYRSLRRTGVKEEHLALLLETAQRAGASLWEFIGKLVEGKGYHSGSAMREALTLSPEILSRLEHFRETLLVYRELAGTKQTLELLARWKEEHCPQCSEGLEKLCKVAARFDTLPSFLQGITLAQEADHERLGGQTLAPEFVSLMTLHAAKGLEFPVVFITGVDDGIIPHTGRLDEGKGVTREKELPREKNQFLEELEEERRLFYVGITRAKEVLVLISARARTVYGRRALFQPSRFLRDIPSDCLKKKIWKDERKKKETEGEEWEQLSLFPGRS